MNAQHPSDERKATNHNSISRKVPLVSPFRFHQLTPESTALSARRPCWKACSWRTKLSDDFREPLARNAPLCLWPLETLQRENSRPAHRLSTSSSWSERDKALSFSACPFSVRPPCLTFGSSWALVNIQCMSWQLHHRCPLECLPVCGRCPTEKLEILNHILLSGELPCSALSIVTTFPSMARSRLMPRLKLTFYFPTMDPLNVPLSNCPSGTACIPLLAGSSSPPITLILLPVFSPRLWRKVEQTWLLTFSSQCCPEI